MVVIIIDEDGREYTSFISQTLDRLKQYDVRSLAIVALTNGEDDSVTAVELQKERRYRYRA